MYHDHPGGKIIPLQEKKGNYDAEACPLCKAGIIPLQEKKGNYDRRRDFHQLRQIIPLQEKKGNYDALYRP